MKNNDYLLHEELRKQIGLFIESLFCFMKMWN